MTTIDGLLVIDKPRGMTSRDAVDRAQTWFPRNTRIGHTGTLDPLATGVLVLCIGTATRLTEYVQQMPKVYRAGITLGATSDTDDADGAITPKPDAMIPDRDRIEQELAAFLGKIEQVPPAYSAAKVQGRRAYALARKGKEFDLQPRQVTIHRIDVLHYESPHLEILVRCGKGTYIRSLARDLGKQLQCGGYIASLRRHSVGWFTATDAVHIDSEATLAREHLLPPWRAIQDWPPTLVSDADAAKLRQGQSIAHVHAHDAYDEIGHVAVVDNAQQMVAVVKPVDGFLQPVKVLVGKESG
ncbi:MAG: tRNA pseudouridine(55) synthase TruB [Gemmataceae bacterium]|nr:tRNA pseudouridine(55) synthase TruB [Gemmataceae bacterium]